MKSSIIEIMLILILLDIQIILFCYMLRIALQTVYYVEQFKRRKKRAQCSDEKSSEKNNTDKGDDLHQEKPYYPKKKHYKKVFYNMKDTENTEKKSSYAPDLNKKNQEVSNTKERYMPSSIEKNDSMEKTVIRLGNVAEGNLNSYGASESVKEKKDGELTITLENDNIVFVLPWNTTLTEQTFKNTLIEKYFEVNQRVVPGCKYKVKKESKAASLRRQENGFILVNRGYLELEEHF